MAVAQANEKRGGVKVDEAPKGLAILGMIGPGIVWAGLAIGGGELVLIPRVGSVYGMMFLWMPLLAICESACNNDPPLSPIGIQH